MLRRLIFFIVYALCFPLLFVAVFILPIIGLVCMFIWIIKGDKNDVLMDWILSPVTFVINLPYKLTGIDEW